MEADKGPGEGHHHEGVYLLVKSGRNVDKIENVESGSVHGLGMQHYVGLVGGAEDVRANFLRMVIFIIHANPTSGPRRGPRRWSVHRRPWRGSPLNSKSFRDL